MAMSRSSSASEGEVVDTRHKANTVNSRNEPAINGSNRSFGLDGAYDDYRALSRSPSPYRRSRAVDRSPSPYRRSRADQAGNDSRGYKRKASPPRSRPDKRYHADRSRHGDPRRAPGPHHGNFGKEQKDVPDRSHAKPISYAEVENPNPVPDFREPLPTDKRPQNSRHGDQQREKSRQSQSQKQQAPAEGPKTQGKQTSVTEDVEM
jgi:serine/threonine-protein kinase PRP4